MVHQRKFMGLPFLFEFRKTQRVFLFRKRRLHDERNELRGERNELHGERNGLHGDDGWRVERNELHDDNDGWRVLLIM